jgi:hypothetical protein
VDVEVYVQGGAFPAPKCTAEPRQWAVAVYVYGCTPLSIKVNSTVYARGDIFYTDKRVNRAVGEVLCLLR